jgi:hypothetical protein
MTFDLLSMAELTLSAAVVIFGFAVLFGRSHPERAAIGAAMTLWFVCILGAGATYLLYYEGGLACLAWVRLSFCPSLH